MYHASPLRLLGIEMSLKTSLEEVNVFTSKGKINPKADRILAKHPALFRQIQENTAFLDESNTTDLRIRLYCVQHNITELPVCKVCGGPVSFYRKGGFNNYCPNKGGSCAAKDSELQEHRTNIIRERYGVDNPMQNPVVQKKASNTMLEKYGVASPIHSGEIREKMRNTIINRYGVDTVAKIPGVAEKRKQTNNARYGAPTPAESMLSPETLEILDDKRKLIELITDFSRRDIMVHLGISQTTLYARLKKHGIDPSEYTLVSNLTSIPQREVMLVLDKMGIEYVVNDKTLIFPKHLDIYVPTHNLAIEFDGVFHHSEKNGKDRNYHRSKTIACNAAGVRLIHVWSSEWKRKREIVLSRIKIALGMCEERIFARKCVIRPVDFPSAREFLDRCHLQGSSNFGEAYGLFFDNKLVAVMSFVQPRFSKKHQWELLRYATLLNTVVVGGASKLFQHFVHKHSPTSIISYCDLRWGTGNMYESIGFEYSHTSNPNYYYFFVNGDTDILSSRQQFQKHKLKDKLETFDPNLTEWQNMQANGYDRIWDCGNNVYVWSMPSISLTEKFSS